VGPYTHERSRELEFDSSAPLGAIPLADRPVEFPTVDDERVGRDARYRYAVADTGDSAGIVKFDAVTGSVAEHAVGADTVAGEAVFVPSAAADRAEDDGWLLTITTRRDGSASQLLVLVRLVAATAAGGLVVVAGAAALRMEELRTIVGVMADLVRRRGRP